MQKTPPKNNELFAPLSGRVTPRFSGLSTFMRLPYLGIEKSDDVEVGIVGVPWDGGTSNRPGARMGPRELRLTSSMMRQVNHDSGMAPFLLANCADLGDTPVNPFDIDETLRSVETYFRPIHERGIATLAAGGDHLITLPILRSLAQKGPVGLVHFDAHMDTTDTQFGKKYAHGTLFRRAIEEGLVNPQRMIQIGIRGGFYGNDSFQWSKDQGIQIVTTEEVYRAGADAIGQLALSKIGEGPVYVSFDIDGLDPVYAPGTGTPEIGGFDTLQAQIMIRALEPLDIVGCDLVEVAPDLDPSGLTTLTGITLMWELLCVLTNSVARRRSAAWAGNDEGQK
jgi:guanidinopropionase